MPKCARCGTKTTGSYTLCYSCNQKGARHSTQSYGTHPCANCGMIVSRDRRYCYPCYQKIVGKKR